MTTPDQPAPPDSPPSIVPHRTQLRWLALAAAGLLVVVGLIWLLNRGSDRERPTPAAATLDTFRPSPQQLKTLTIEPVALHRFETIEVADGRIAVNADRTTPVYSPYSGRVIAIIAGPGERIAQGATLATIEASEFADAQNAFASAVAQVRLTRAVEARKRDLLEANGASQQEWQQAQADRATAEAALSAARSHLRIFGQSDAAIDALETHEPADARIALRAPIAGVVVDRQISPGQYVAAGSGTPLYTIADVSSVWIVGTLSERTAPRLKRGQAVAVTVPAWPGRTFTARLDYVAPTIDPATHRLTVRAVIDNADGALRPEMLATLAIEAGEAQSAPAVRASAIVYEGARAHVWVATSDGAIGLREIRAGRSHEGLVEVLEGLKAGEQVVTRGSLFIDRAARLD
ncbi:MAG TPA: efflux RND transporter periplasmic adaptor subunit [Steroidobacteraceae bacterium]|nr:efflux RND transporter periplasmic adaptor subunit [Steroidobacteraceae bacterium]